MMSTDRSRPCRGPALAAWARAHRLDRYVCCAGCPVCSAYSRATTYGLESSPRAWQAGRVQNNVNTPRVLAVGEVHYVGDPLAVVVAEDPGIAADALIKSLSTTRSCRRSSMPEKAALDGAPQLHENAPNNVVLTWKCGKDAATVDAAIDGSPVKSARRRQSTPDPNVRSRLAARSAVRPGTGDYTLWATSQAPHVHAPADLRLRDRNSRAEDPCHFAGYRRRVRLQDLPLLRHAAGARPGQASRPAGQVHGGSVRELPRPPTGATTSPISRSAPARTARSPGSNVKTYANLGAYLSTIAPGIPTTLYGRMVSGCYKIPNIHCDVTGVYTNTAWSTPIAARVVPKPPSSSSASCDLLADATGIDPAEVRRRNFIQPEDFPYDDTGSACCRTTAATTSLRWTRRWRRRLHRASRRTASTAERGAKSCSASASRPMSKSAASLRPSGSGSGEGWGAGLWESANVKVHLTGKVVVTTGSLPHGQGHETTFAQLVADELGVPYDDVDVEHATRRVRRSAMAPTAAARLPSVARRSTRATTKIKEKARQDRRAPARGDRGGYRL